MRVYILNYPNCIAGLIGDWQMDYGMDRDEVRAKVLKLYDERKAKEQEIIENLEILKREKVTFDEPLVDNEGYPRAYVDIYAIRTARNRIICLRNDCRDLTKLIEKYLQTYHGHGSDSFES